VTFEHLLVDRTNLEGSGEADAGVLRHELDGVFHVSGFEHTETAQLFLGLGEGAVGHDYLAPFLSQRLGGASTSKRLPAFEPVPVLHKLIVIGEALGDHGLALGVGYGVPLFLVGVSQTGEFHDFLLWLWNRAQSPSSCGSHV
jgi:hypothetical protein